MRAQVKELVIILDESEAFDLFQSIEVSLYNRVTRNDTLKNLEIYNLLSKHFGFIGRMNDKGELMDRLK